MSAPRGCNAPGGSDLLMGGVKMLPGGVDVIPFGNALRHDTPPPPVNRMTDRCKIITLATNFDAAGKYGAQVKRDTEGQ